MGATIGQRAGACSCLLSGSRIPHRRRQRLGGSRLRSRSESVQCFRRVGGDRTPTHVPPAASYQLGMESSHREMLFLGSGTSPPSALRYGGAFCRSARVSSAEYAIERSGH
ncbi:hypothetical protein V5799_016229 [Amblyomma americanum]|uniref:Uncharacterized protein n=1 Tax=Amblyomma americanum TaxID=6943 RepID=A0AAQ4F5P8_AMBAM